MTLSGSGFRVGAGLCKEKKAMRVFSDQEIVSEPHPSATSADTTEENPFEGIVTEKEALPEESFVLNTRFGSRTIAHSKLITMPHGMPGFDHLRRFVVLNLSEENNDGSFRLLQSIDDTEIAFFVLPMWVQ